MPLLTKLLTPLTAVEVPCRSVQQFSSISANSRLHRQTQLTRWSSVARLSGWSQDARRSNQSSRSRIAGISSLAGWSDESVGAREARIADVSGGAGRAALSSSADEAGSARRTGRTWRTPRSSVSTQASQPRHSVTACKHSARSHLQPCRMLSAQLLQQFVPHRRCFPPMQYVQSVYSSQAEHARQQYAHDYTTDFDFDTRTPPTTQFLQAGCPSCRPINSVKALKTSHKKASVKHTPQKSSVK